MILKVNEQYDIVSSLDSIGLKKAIKQHGAVLIKINLARPPEPGHPRTDPTLLSKVIRYITDNKGSCTIAESADGYLRNNLVEIGIEDTIRACNVDVIDLDFEEAEKVVIDDEEHYIPKCLRNYGVRIGMPATSKRPGMIFSNNVKLFVGAVPRRMYQIGETVRWRPRIHIDLHKSVANIYRAIQQYAPFDFFINGGLAMDENKGEFKFEGILIGNDGIELDLYVLKELFNIDIPEYLTKCSKSDFPYYDIEE